MQDLPSNPAVDLGSAFRAAMRRQAASVMIVTTRAEDGSPHGMVASSVIPVSMEPPSMMVAINRTASLHPVLTRARRFMVNLLGTRQSPLLVPFSSSQARAQRFRSDDWLHAWDADSRHLPRLRDALASIECQVDLATDYGTHTLFVGHVREVHCATDGCSEQAPLVWLAGQHAPLAQWPPAPTH